MKHTAIYCRISQDRTDDALGVQRQEKDCRQLAARKGWVVVEVYCDNDVSASSAKPRKAYQQMLEDIAAGQIDSVIVWDVDRLTRRPRELEDWIDMADERGLALASVGGEIDLSTGQGRLMARIKGSVARHESDQTSRRIKAKQSEIAAAGGYHGGGSRSFGFEDDRVTHRDSEVALIRDAAGRLLNGATLRSVCRDFNDRGYLTSTKRLWDSNTLRKLVTGPRVAGYRQHNGTLTKAIWAPILDEETWQAMRDALDPEGRRVSGIVQRRYTWTGLLRCWKCGGLLGPRLITGAPAYACRVSARYGGCGGTAVRRLPADEVLDELLLQRVEREDLGEAEPEPNDPTTDLENRVLSLEGRLETLASDFADDVLDAEGFRVGSRVVADRLETARADLRQERSRQRTRTGVRLDPTKVREHWPSMEPRDRRALAGSYIDRVVVGPAVRGKNVFDPSRLGVHWL